MALIDFLSGTGKVNGDDNGNLWARLRDTVGNSISKTKRELLPSTQEHLLIAGTNDDHAVPLRVDRKGNQILGNYVPELQDNFEGATINAHKWTATSVTFTSAQATLTGYRLNTSASVAATVYTILQSQRLFSKLPRVPLQIKARKRHNLVAGSLADFGFGIPTTTTTMVTNGVCIRFTASGVVQGVVTFNGAEIAIANIISQTDQNGNTIGGNLNMAAAYYTSGYFVYDIIIDDDNVVFTIQDTTTGDFIGTLNLNIPNTAVKAWGATALPAYFRVWNASAPSQTPIYDVTETQVLSTDWAVNPNINQVAASLGLSQSKNPFTAVQLANHANSAAPASAALSNTAAGYTTLGGKFQFVAVAGAETDYALFGFTVPAGARFLFEGIDIDTFNTVVAVATTATILEWAVGLNSSAVSLATANITRIEVGVQTFAIADAVGKAAQRLSMMLATPEVCESARFFHVILKMPVATATATEIFRGTVTVKGRFL
jgi:hypothetical protein